MTRSPDMQRIKHIRDYCDAIQSDVQRFGNSFETFSSDDSYQRAVAMCILQIGELGRGLSEEFRESTSCVIPWTAIRSVRNRIVHHYGDINFNTLWDSVQNDIPVLKEFCEKCIRDYQQDNQSHVTMEDQQEKKSATPKKKKYTGMER